MELARAHTGFAWKSSMPLWSPALLFRLPIVCSPEKQAGQRKHTERIKMGLIFLVWNAEYLVKDPASLFYEGLRKPKLNPDLFLKTSILNLSVFGSFSSQA